ncbi:MAG: HAMP domain-containing sensor histidine kinase [Ferruginibacter sp.]
MKPLLTKTTRPFLLYVLIVLVISVPVYYFVVDAIWKAELDEHNRIIADKSAYALNQLQLTDAQLLERIALWNSIQPGTNIEPVTEVRKDSMYTVKKPNRYSSESAIDRFRCLATTVQVNHKPFRFTVETNIEESEETIGVLAAVTVFFFIVIVAGLLLLSRRQSRTVWQPFRDTLEKLKTFNLNRQMNIAFSKTDTQEFEELNQSLHKLIDHTISVYRTQKEFTENASHELQTPLAILKNKLDILLQSADLTQKQYQLAEEMNNALNRSARINKNLLLLAKIENSQFDKTESVAFDQLLEQSMDTLKEHFESKHIVVTSDIEKDVVVNGNSGLTEVLINNLLLNAIRHTVANGSVTVTLSRKSFSVANSGEQPLDETLLFKRFSRHSADNSGSGLGLAIVKEICKFQQWQAGYHFANGRHQFETTF